MIRTDGEKERATMKYRRRGMKFRVQHADEGLHGRRTSVLVIHNENITYIDLVPETAP